MNITITSGGKEEWDGFNAIAAGYKIHASVSKKLCESCQGQVISQAKEGHEPKICGLCATRDKLCPWCLNPYEIHKSYEVVNYGTPEERVIYDGDVLEHTWCPSCYDGFGIEENGEIL